MKSNEGIRSVQVAWPGQTWQTAAVTSEETIKRAFSDGPKAVETIASSCTSGTCPTVYRSDRGTLIVQGYIVDPEAAGVSLPEGEKLVEIPIDLLRSVVGSIG